MTTTALHAFWGTVKPSRFSSHGERGDAQGQGGTQGGAQEEGRSQGYGENGGKISNKKWDL